MSTVFKTYKEIPMIMEQAEKKNIEIMSTLKDYILQFSGNFSELKDKFTKLSTDPLVKPEKSKDKGDKQEIHSELYKAIPELAINQIIQIPCYKAASEDLKQFAESNITKTLNEYSTQNKQLKQKFIEQINKFDKCRQLNDDAALAYKNAGLTLQAAEKANDKNLSKLKEEFVKSRSKAIQIYQESSKASEEITCTIEDLLTQLEDLEIWRAEQLRNILIDFSNTLILIAAKFIQGSTEINEAVSEIPMTKDANDFASLHKFRKPETDDFFQVFRLDPHVTKFLDKQYLFPEEIIEGGKLFTVKEDFDGPNDYLIGHKGEIVCVLEQKDKSYLCKNINESVGLLPSNILEPFN